jgi:hypothetical protein
VANNLLERPASSGGVGASVAERFHVERASFITFHVEDHIERPLVKW